jgi:hypothetical protein
VSLDISHLLTIKGNKEVKKRIRNTWIISEVLRTACFTFKNERILQNTFTGLQCNLQCAFYPSGPTFGQVLCSCLDAFVVDASDYSGHLIRHLLNASEAFPTEWFIHFWEKVEVWWAPACFL